MKIYKTIINPDGIKEEIVTPLWDSIAEKVCDDQVYPLYTSINNFISLFPLCAAESIINDFMEHLKQEAFLIDLNAATNEDGIVDWEYFFRYNEFLMKLYSNLSEMKENFNWTDFMMEYNNSK